MTSHDWSFWFRGLHNAKKTTTTRFQIIVVVSKCPTKKSRWNEKTLMTMNSTFIMVVSNVPTQEKKPKQRAHFLACPLGFKSICNDKKPR
jgi:hypothetical protein